MKIKFINAKILDLSSPTGFQNGEVLTSGGMIEKVGKNLNNDSCDRTIDLNGKILMPGLIDAHTHSAMTLFRGVKDDATLQEWLFENMIPLEEKLQSEDVYWGAMLAGLEYLRNGITCIDDMYHFPEGVAKGVQKLGIRARVAVGANSDGKGTCADKIKLCNKYVTNPEIISYVVFAHAIYTVDDKTFDSLVDYASKAGLHVATHLSETLTEVGDCSVKHNMTPPQLLESYGFLDRGATLYHCVHIDKDDISLLHDYDSCVVSCPGSNVKLASGIAPLQSMTEGGLTIALGTDGPASNNKLDMFREMYLASVLSKVSLYDPTVIPAQKVLEMATVNGAKALHIDKLGKIEEGFKADLIVVDTTKPHFQPQNNLLSSLVYTATGEDVVLTMVNGEILYENGKYATGIDENEIYSNCERIIKRLKGK